MEDSRTHKSIKNIIYSFGTQLIILLINFLSRTIFIKFLGVEMLGISGLFTNILTLLSLAELGFGSAIIYSLYKPLKDNDKEKISALINYYKKAYYYIIAIITFIGVLIIPFLPKIITSDLNHSSLLTYYILFLINTICSYLFVYKSSIINADQKIYITKIINVTTMIIQFICQMIIIILTRNYILFLIAQIICTLLNNIISSLIANKLYPFLKNNNILELSERKKIKRNVSSIFLYKICGTVLNNTDNIYISTLINTITVGYYSNYYMLTSAITNFIYILFNAMTASIGNLITENNKIKQEQIFRQLNYICFVITGICTLELLGLTQDFITLWLDSSFILNNYILYIIIANFYIYTIQNPVWAYRDTTGLFKDAKNDTIILVISNVILSYIFGKIWGLFGILLATAVSRLFITYWHQPYMLYKKVFNMSIKEYAIKQIYYIVVLAISIISIIFLNQYIIGYSIITFIIKGLIILIISSLIFFVFTFPTKECQACLKKLQKFINKKV